MSEEKTFTAEEMEEMKRRIMKEMEEESPAKMNDPEIIEGTTSSGFHFKILKDTLDNYEFLEDLAVIDSGNVGILPNVIRNFLGSGQTNGLKNHLRKETGRVSVKEMVNEFMEIMQACGAPGKNS